MPTNEDLMIEAKNLQRLSKALCSDTAGAAALLKGKSRQKESVCLQSAPDPGRSERRQGGLAGDGGVNMSLLCRGQGVGTLVAPEMRRRPSRSSAEAPWRRRRRGLRGLRAVPASAAGRGSGGSAGPAWPGLAAAREPCVLGTAGARQGQRELRSHSPGKHGAGSCLSSTSVLCSPARLEFSLRQSQGGMSEEELTVDHCQDR